MTDDVVAEMRRNVGTMGALAAEIGLVDVVPESSQILAHYLVRLLEDLQSTLYKPCVAPHAAAGSVCGVFLFALRSNVGGRQKSLMRLGEQMGQIISILDDDAGVPECGWMRGLKACANALAFGLEDSKTYLPMEHLRWPAQAGFEVFHCRNPRLAADAISLEQCRLYLRMHLLTARMSV